MIPVHDDNPAHLTPWSTRALIAACALVFLWQSMSGDARFGAIIAGMALVPLLKQAHIPLFRRH